MKKIVFSVLVTVSLLFSLSQCSDDASNPSETKDLEPLAVGNYWIYKINYYDSLGNVEKTDVDTTNITSINNYGSETYYLVDDIAFLINKSNGLYSYGLIQDTLKLYSFYKYPGNNGEQWVMDGDTVKIENNNYDVTVPKGNFNCYRYFCANSSGNINVNAYIVFCPGIGIVEEELYFSYKGGKMNLSSKRELIDFKLN